MENKEFAKELEKRTRRFAVQIIKISTKLPGTTEGRVFKNQLTKCGTSIGANYHEANRSRSKSDFRGRIKICESESSETQYWLQLIIEVKWLTQKEIEKCYKECCELLALFTTIANRSR